MTHSDDNQSVDSDYSFKTIDVFQVLDILPEMLNEREKIEGIDPQFIIKTIDEMLGEGEVSKVSGWDLRKESAEISCWTKWSGTEER